MKLFIFKKFGIKLLSKNDTCEVIHWCEYVKKFTYSLVNIQFFLRSENIIPLFQWVNIR